MIMQTRCHLAQKSVRSPTQDADGYWFGHVFRLSATNGPWNTPHERHSWTIWGSPRQSVRLGIPTVLSSRHVWIFGRDLHATEAYIKVALQPDTRRRPVVRDLIWAFHASEYQMQAGSPCCGFHE